jgi:phosphoglycolate phosphatase-like HAD superfamily hydrolase
VSSHRPTVFLFDIDGTLLLSGGAGRRSFERAFEIVCGRRDACNHFSFAGMTDPAIARAGLIAIGREPDAATASALIETYLGLLADEVASRPVFAVMPAAHDTVAALRREAHFAVGLGTGNVRRGADVKLARAELAHLFDFGGFGCDHEDRGALLRKGVERGAARLGVPADDARVVVIGDTPRDVSAALAIGAECIGVGTGGVDPAELVALGAVAGFVDLAADGVLDVLRGVAWSG